MSNAVVPMINIDGRGDYCRLVTDAEGALANGNRDAACVVYDLLSKDSWFSQSYQSTLEKRLVENPRIPRVYVNFALRGRNVLEQIKTRFNYDQECLTLEKAVKTTVKCSIVLAFMNGVNSLPEILSSIKENGVSSTPLTAWATGAAVIVGTAALYFNDRQTTEYR